MRFVGLVLALFSFIPAFSQLVEFPLASQKSENRTTISKNISGRTQSTSLTLPFWDDFSYSDVLHYPDTNIWLYGNTVYLNNGIGINPPSKNVVTFDGLDSQGKTYSVNDILAKGRADTLVSKPIRMDLVTPALRPTTYISFFYQVKGRGESPDPGDNLTLWFRNSDKKWEVIYTIENTDAISADTFYQVLIPITDAKFFHDGFQFKFQNFARLSGAYDTWNVDYIYINTNRNPNDKYYPDRTVSSQLNSLFKDYYAMPLEHFLKNTAGNLKVPSLTLYSMDAGEQPFSFNVNSEITTRKGKVSTTVSSVLDFEVNPTSATLKPLTFEKLSLNNIPPVTAFTPADEISVKLIYKTNSDDNETGGTGGYTPQYIPIDFRMNDTTRVTYNLSSYYAYDDGSAEYAFKLSQAGSYLALKYLFKSTVIDTLTGVRIFFPEFGDNSTQSLLLQVRSDLSDSPNSILYQQIIPVKRSTRAVDSLTLYTFDPAILIHGDFYIGWKQLTNAAIPVGLDKNNDNADKMFYNTNGTWIQNTVVVGSPMVRPVFGKGIPVVITGVENRTHDPIYPNPTSRICFLPYGAEQIRAMDMTGRKIDIEVETSTDRTSLTFTSPASGMVIVRYVLDGRVITEKIMVLAE